MTQLFLYVIPVLIPGLFLKVKSLRLITISYVQVELPETKPKGFRSRLRNKLIYLWLEQRGRAIYVLPSTFSTTNVALSMFSFSPFPPCFDCLILFISVF